MRRMIKILIVLVLFGAGAVLMVSGMNKFKADPNNPEQVALGKTIYAQNCAECHGDQLQGETDDWKTRKEDGSLPAPPHNEDGHTWHHADKLIFDYTKMGGKALIPGNDTSGMPGFSETLTDAEIWAVLAFIKTHWPANILERQLQLSDMNNN